MIIPEVIPDKAYFRPDEIAAIFSVKRKIVYDWISLGKLNAINFAGSRTLRISYESAVKFKNNNGKGFMNNNKKAIERRMVSRIRHRIIFVLKGITKSKTTLEFIGCSVEEFRAHIEKQFQPGMTWDNYGKTGWHLDHIIPCARFDMSKPEHQKLCFHYTNLQPLWAHNNLSKGKKVTRRNIRKFITNRSINNMS